LIESVPVFPLPAAVLFPGIVIPLHIFEARYCSMMADTMADDERMAIAMIKAGTEDDDAPEVHSVAGIGHVIHCEKLLGGRYNVLVQGIGRIKLLEELKGEQEYRRFRAQWVPQPTDDDIEEAKFELLRLQGCVISLMGSILQTDAELVEVLRSTSDPVKLADILGATVVGKVEQQQDLLNTLHLKKRIAKLIDLMVDVLATTGEIPPGAQSN